MSQGPNLENQPKAAKEPAHQELKGLKGLNEPEDTIGKRDLIVLKDPKEGLEAEEVEA